MSECSWREAVLYAERWVEEAEKQAVKAATARTDVERRIETERAAGYMGIARGAISTLAILRPGDRQLDELRGRLNHCPVLMISGKRKEAV